MLVILTGEMDFDLIMTPKDAVKMRRVDFEYWTHKQLADKLGILPQHVSNMEGGIRPIGVKMACRLCKGFSCNPEIFIS